MNAQNRAYAGCLAVYFAQGVFQIGLHLCKVAGGGDLFAPNEDVIPTCVSVCRQCEAGDFAQAAFGAVARNGIANFFGAREANVDDWIIVVAVSGLKQECFGALAQLVVTREVLRPILHCL